MLQIVPRAALTSCKNMDAAAYLTNQGWPGDGHALHYSGRGITKPVHVSQKANVLGVGKKQHDAYADQWWARAFDDTLKGLNTSKSEATGKTEQALNASGAQTLQLVGTGAPKRISQGGLYSNFVRGQSLSGTLVPEKSGRSETQPQLDHHMKQKRVSKDGDPSATVPKDVEMSKTKRRQQVRVTAGYSEMIGFGAGHQDPNDVRIGSESKKPRERSKDTETIGRGRQKRREKRAKRVREAGGSLKLPKESRTTTINNNLTSDGPKKRSKEQVHTVKDADPLAARLCNMSPDGNRKNKDEKRRRATASQCTRVIEEEWRSV